MYYYCYTSRVKGNLSTYPKTKMKELIKLYKMKKLFLEDDKEEYGDGFGGF